MKTLPESEQYILCNSSNQIPEDKREMVWNNMKDGYYYFNDFYSEGYSMPTYSVFQYGCWVNDNFYIIVNFSSDRFGNRSRCYKYNAELVRQITGSVIDPSGPSTSNVNYMSQLFYSAERDLLLFFVVTSDVLYLYYTTESTFSDNSVWNKMVVNNSINFSILMGNYNFGVDNGIIYCSYQNNTPDSDVYIFKTGNNNFIFTMEQITPSDYNLNALCYFSIEKGQYFGIFYHTYSSSERYYSVYCIGDNLSDMLNNITPYNLDLNVSRNPSFNIIKNSSYTILYGSSITVFKNLSMSNPYEYCKLIYSPNGTGVSNQSMCYIANNDQIAYIYSLNKNNPNANISDEQVYEKHCVICSLDFVNHYINIEEVKDENIGLFDNTIFTDQIYCYNNNFYYCVSNQQSFAGMLQYYNKWYQPKPRFEEGLTYLKIES